MMYGLLMMKTEGGSSADYKSAETEAWHRRHFPFAGLQILRCGLLLTKTEGGSSADYKSAETWGLAAPAFALRRITNPAVRVETFFPQEWSLSTVINKRTTFMNHQSCWHFVFKVFGRYDLSAARPADRSTRYCTDHLLILRFQHAANHQQTGLPFREPFLVPGNDCFDALSM
jgi:hypothetical protein